MSLEDIRRKSPEERRAHILFELKRVVDAPGVADIDDAKAKASERLRQLVQDEGLIKKGEGSHFEKVKQEISEYINAKDFGPGDEVEESPIEKRRRERKERRRKREEKRKAAAEDTGDDGGSVTEDEKVTGDKADDSGAERTKTKESNAELLAELEDLIADLETEVGSKLDDILSTIKELKNLYKFIEDNETVPESVFSEIESLSSRLDANEILLRMIKAEIGNYYVLVERIIVIFADLSPKKEDEEVVTETKKDDVKDENLDISFDRFKELSEKERKSWLFKALKLFMDSEIFYKSAKNPGEYLRDTFDKGLSFLEEKGSSEEKKLVSWIKARLELSMATNFAGVRYGLDYDGLLDGGPSLKDSTTTWEGLRIEGTTFNVGQLGGLLGERFEIDKGDKERLEFILDVADAWFKGKRFPDNERGAMYAVDLRKKLEARVIDIHERANRRAPKGSKTKAGYFLAMNKYTDNLKDDFYLALEKVFQLTYEGTDQIDEEGRLFSLANSLVTFFDFRNTRAQDQYMAASSPVDEGVQKTIKASSLRVNPAVVVSYANIGKGVGNYFNPALALGRPGKRVLEFLGGKDKETYMLKYRHSIQVMEAWLDWYAPIPDQFVDGLDGYRFYEADSEGKRERLSPFPRISEYYWYDLDNRRRLIEDNAEGLESFRNYLENAKNFEAFIGKCLEGASVSLSHDFRTNPSEFDMELTEKIGNIMSEVSNAISATKGMILDAKRGHEHGIDGYYVARALYIFARQLILQVAQDREKGLNNLDYDVLLAFVSRAVWRSLRSGGTMDGIMFYSPEKDKDGRVEGTISVMDYVKSRIPNPSIKRTSTGYKIDFTAGKNRPTTDYIRAIAYSDVRVHNNQHHLNELSERNEAYFEELKQKVKKQLTGRTDHSHRIVSISEYGIPLPANIREEYTNGEVWGKTVIPHHISGKKTEEAKSVDK